MKKRTTCAIFLAFYSLVLCAGTITFGRGRLTVKKVAHNAVRIQYEEGTTTGNILPDWLYLKESEVGNCDVKVDIDTQRQVVTISNKAGQKVFTAISHQLESGKATLSFYSPKDEHLYGLGQFQDGYSNVRGLSRILTQVNTQNRVR